MRQPPTASENYIRDGCKPTLVTAKIRVTKFSSLMSTTSVTCKNPSLLSHNGDGYRIYMSLITHIGDGCIFHASLITKKGDGFRKYMSLIRRYQ